MWAVLFSDGAISLKDIDQITTERWVPIAAIRPKNNPDAPATVLLFHSRDVAYSFTKRNMKKLSDWLKGGVELTDLDVENIKARCKVEELSFPKRYDSHPEFELTYEVVELCDVPDVRYIRANV